MDLVGTCPKTFWREWLEEGDCAGDTPSADPDSFGWWTRHRLAGHIRIGDRFYVVAHGRCRGYATVSQIDSVVAFESVCIYRVDPVAVTIPEAIAGFRGLRKRWWKREDEIPFPNWRTEGVPRSGSRVLRPAGGA